MGYFDRFKSRPAPPPSGAPGPQPVANPVAAGGMLPQLAAARARLEGGDLPGAMAIYEAVLAAAGDRTDVLVTISGDLGTTGHVREIIEIVAPRYDAERHGPAAGINLLQAYLAVHEPEAAQHVLDVLFTLGRPELQERLLGFSSAVAQMLQEDARPAAPPPGGATTVNFATISKPIWFYGLEEILPHLLPKKTGRLRRVAFTQLALPGMADAMEQAARPEDELGRLSRAVPLWLAETFFFGAGYEAFAAVGVIGQKHHALLPGEWRAEEVQRLAASNAEGMDYVITGRLRDRNSDFELGLQIWEVKKLRELKAFTARWSPAAADETLSGLHGQLRTYMEWTPLPAGEGLAYVPPASPLPYLHALGSSLTLFLLEKGLLTSEHAAVDQEIFLQAARANPDDTRAHLLLATALRRLHGRGVAPLEAALAHLRNWETSAAAAAAGLSGLSAGL
jgi:hypothetical protein